MKEIKNVLIIANGNKEEANAISSSMLDYVQQKGLNCSLLLTKSENDITEIPNDTDLVISLGGDGTVLSTARVVHKYGIPILAVNLGTFGYITEIGSDEWKDNLDALLNGKSAISRRLMIKVTVIRDGVKIFTEHALNEAVISSSGISKVIKMELSIDKTEAGTFRADGMIIATPTGSTGYSLAAGGPILDAEMSALIITPVCPFTLSNRPLVIGGDSIINIKAAEGQRTGLMLTVDGQLNFPLKENDIISVEKSRGKTLLISSSVRNYIEVVRDKLHWSGEMHA